MYISTNCQPLEAAFEVGFPRRPVQKKIILKKEPVTVLPTLLLIENNYVTIGRTILSLLESRERVLPSFFSFI